MNRSIRTRFFLWLAAHTAIVFVAIGLALVSFDVVESLRNPQQANAELEEVAVVATAMLALFPLSLVGAWLVSRRLLRPWKVLVAQAERIGGGGLEGRIEVQNPRDEIGRLATTLNQAFDRYQLLLDRLQRFNYDASHQLRNPLAAIRTRGEVCLKQVRSPEEYRAVLGAILEDVERLGRTVNQLLLLARAAGGSLEEGRRTVDLAQLAREVAREGRAIGETRGLEVRLDVPEEPCLAVGVPELLREALANLLDNALKVSPDGGRIDVALLQEEEGLARLSVSDQGPGLPPDRRAAVFRPYARAGSPGKESVGLGLAIVADICRAHGGRFGVDAPPSGGGCFWIELPRSGED